MTLDQVFVPKTRSDLGLPPIDKSKTDLFGSRITEEVRKELLEAIGDSPLGSSFEAFTYLVSLDYHTSNSLGTNFRRSSVGPCTFSRMLLVRSIIRRAPIVRFTCYIPVLKDTDNLYRLQSQLPNVQASPI